MVESVESLEKKLGDIESPSERASRITAWQAASAANFYIKLREEAQDVDGLKSESLLPPSTSSLIRYFRLEDGLSDSLSFAELWGKATKRMLNDLGFSTR